MRDIFNVNPLISEMLSSAAGSVIALVILWGIYRLVRQFLDKLMVMGKEFIEAQQSQATSMSGLTGAITQVVSRDDKSHQELRILLKVISGEVRGIRENAQSIPDIKNKVAEIDHIKNKMEDLDDIKAKVDDIPFLKESLRQLNLKGDS